MSKLGVKIRLLRESKGITQPQLAAGVGLSQPVIARIERGEQLSTKKLPEIAKFLNVSLSELDPRFAQAGIVDRNPNASESPDKVQIVQVVGVVQAGVWTEFEDFEDANHEEIAPLPGKFPGLPQVAYKVRGNSMDAARIFDGDYVLAVAYFDARADIRDGDTVIVERKRGGTVERTVKIIKVVGKEVHFCPQSSDPRFKPIVVKVNKHLREHDDTEVRILGLVVGRYGHV